MFTLNPLARALFCVTWLPLAMASVGAHAGIVDGTERSINASTPAQDWTVRNGGVLNATGATTFDINVIEGSRANIEGSQVTATGTLNALAVASGSHAEVNNTQLLADRVAVLIRPGATGALRNSEVRSTGANQAAVQVASGAQLLLENTQVVSERGAGAMFNNGQMQAVGSRIEGRTNGMLVTVDPAVPNDNLIELDNTVVEGIDGAAVRVDSYDLGTGTSTTLVLANGSSLVSGNGNLVEVARGAELDLQVDNSQLVGDMVVDVGSRASLELRNAAQWTGRLVNVENVAINSGARWTMVEDSSIENLSMAGGAIRFGEANEYQRLTVGELSGSGTFIMDVDIGQGLGDFLDVTGNATGRHEILIASAGADPLRDAQLQVVQIGGGDAQFDLAGGAVDLGTWAYDLEQRGNGWFLNANQRQVSASTATVLGLQDATASVWYGEMTSLRSRMGELRLDGGTGGLWMRTYGNRYQVDSGQGRAYQQNQQGLSLGTDTRLAAGDGQWRLGVMGGYSRSELSLKRGSEGETNSYYAGLYATWLDAASGYYLDSSVKLNRFQHQARARLSDGKEAKGRYANLGTGATVEFGRHMALHGGWFIEPFTQWSGLVAQGKDYRLDNGLRVEGETSHSLVGKVGSTVGHSFDLDQGNSLRPYLRAAWGYEFAKGNEIKVNGNRFASDLSGQRAELGAGVTLSLSSGWQVYADLETTHGGRVEQPWGGSVGVRLGW
ncbi:autotransporter outer membrane beta-barrel domain-containing protein [Pseudomonas sp. nanlin1]|uniref:autotransporter outer membrane beta-barrel domain-containing protein n=1 Tax=Pseudomonas sp. nanlin1 TaxID=3040605 RepID=UPI00388D4773